jgi:hypothetical protein
MNTQPNALLRQARVQATVILQRFAQQADFLEQLLVAFGDSVDRNIALGIRQQFRSGDFSLIPEIQVRSGGELGTANGAYAAAIDEIFVSSDFLAQHQPHSSSGGALLVLSEAEGILSRGVEISAAGDVNAVTELLLEEIGHKLDRLLNGTVDSPGDEGAIFRLLAIGYDVSAQTLAGLKSQDDHGVITVDGQSIEIEKQGFTGNSEHNVLIGTSEDDTFDLQDGAISIDGRDGGDSLFINNRNDNDDITINYGGGLGYGAVTGGPNDGTTFQSIETVEIATGFGNDNINVSAASGHTNNNNYRFPNRIYSGAGNDTLTGGAWDDEFTPGIGADRIDGGGGGGYDTLFLDNSSDNADITINYTNTTNGRITGGSNDGTTFRNIEFIFVTLGSGNNYINVSAAIGGRIGSSSQIGSGIGSGTGNDTFIGSAGDDNWFNGGGADKLFGGDGNDLYYVEGKLGGGTVIDDSSGTNDSFQLADYSSLAIGDVSRSGTTLLIDINRDGVFNPAADLSINHYFANTTGNVRGAGFIENLLYGLSGSTVLNVSVRNDFNGDGKSDILWRNDYGSVALWQMNGANVASTALTSTPSLAASWKTAGTGDFDSDGKSDILWRNDDGRVVIWQMNGATVVSSTLTSTPSLDASWKTAGTADFDGDGKSDILWRNDNTGAVAIWAMNGSTVLSSTLTSIPSLAASWKTAGTGDFNGDGTSDILWRNDDGSVALWQMSGSTVVSSSLTSSQRDGSWKINGTGDFDDDGKTDILWRNDNTGAVDLWKMNGATMVSSHVIGIQDSSWNAAGIGDFNGNGKSDILWRNTSGVGAVQVWQMNGYNLSNFSQILTSISPDSTNWKIAGVIV